MRQGDKKSEMVGQLLKSLLPRESDDVSLLRFVLSCAQQMMRGTPNLMMLRSEGPGLDITDFLSSIPDEARKYFHGLVEALEIYQSIHGHPFRIQGVSAADKSLYELKQIREMCLEEGLRSIY